jgi:selenide,water dikinase
MGLGGDVTGSVAVVHALSDLYTSFCLPLSATLCLGLSHRAKTDGSAAQLLGAARATLLNHGVQFGGGHTVYNDTMFLSVSVVGERLTKREPVFRPGREYDILISKPIGTGIYLSANRSGLLSAEDLDGLRSHLMVTNEEASQEALGVLENGRGHLAMLTDVTGFGLLQTLRVGLPADVVATVNAEFVPLLPRTVDLIENHGITTSLGDANLIASIDDTAVSVALDDLAYLSALSDPQTSGGLLMALDSSVASSLPLGAYWHKIGKIVARTEAMEPALAVR